MSAGAVLDMEAGGARASVSLTGGEWLRWFAGGRELLWKPDPAFWTQTAPVLFPVCGWTRHGEARVDGLTYPLGLHGFASRMEFETVERGVDFARLLLRDTPETRSIYPFAFELALDYRLSAESFEIRGEVRNTGAVLMPYAFGLHPGFRWPFAGGDAGNYLIEFEKAERPRVPVIVPGGLFSPDFRAVPARGRALALAPEIFAHEALCFLDARSRKLGFQGPGGETIGVETTGFPHIVLWSMPGAPFLCIESWTGYGDPEGFAGELIDKPSMIALAPGGGRSHAVKYSFRREPLIS